MFCFKELEANIQVDETDTEKYESDLELLGVTGLEDLLQDNVKDCIRDFKTANIKVWMLTGDKEETAHSVAIACGIFNGTLLNKPFKVNATDQEELRNQLEGYLKVLNVFDPFSEPNQVADENALKKKVAFESRTALVSGSVIHSILENEVLSRIFA